MTDLTRLELLRRAALGGAALSIPGLLAACGGDDEEAAGTTTGASAALAGTLRFSNWQLYIDRDPKKKSPSLEQFTAQTGVNVNYVEDVNDNATYFGKIQGPLSQGRGIDRDIIVMTDNSRFPGLLVSKQWVEELDKSRIPNITNLIEAQQSPPFDPDRSYSLPWLSGITGIATNMSASGGEVVTTMQQLLEDTKLKGKVTLLTEVADTMSPIMLENGDDPSKVTDESWKKALDRIQKAVDSGQIRRFTGNDYVADLEKGNIAVALSWSGDVATGLAANKDSPLEPARAGQRHLDGQHVHPPRGPCPDGLRVHELRPRPEGRRDDRGRHRLHLGRQGCQGRGGEARPRVRQQPADLPRRRDPLERPPVRLGGAEQPGLHRAMAVAARRMKAPCT